MSEKKLEPWTGPWRLYEGLQCALELAGEQLADLEDEEFEEVAAASEEVRAFLDAAQETMDEDGNILAAGSLAKAMRTLLDAADRWAEVHEQDDPETNVWEPVSESGAIIDVFLMNIAQYPPKDAKEIFKSSFAIQQEAISREEVRRLMRPERD